MIPKDGGNRFSGSVFFAGTGSGLQSNNLTDDLQSEGLTSVNAVRQGVRLQRRVRWPDRQGSDLVLRVGARLGHDDGRGEPVCRRQHLGPCGRLVGRLVAVRAGPQQPDLSRGNRPGGGIRFTVKPSEKDKFTVSYDRQRNFQDQLTGQLETGTIKNEANAGYCQSQSVLQGTWTRPQSTKLLLDAGATVSRVQLRRIRQRPLPERLRGVRRRPGQQRLDQRHQPRLHVQRRRQQEHGPVASDQRPIQPLLSDRRPQHQDRRVLDVRAQRRACHLLRPGARAGRAVCRCRTASTTARRVR